MTEPCITIAAQWNAYLSNEGPTVTARDVEVLLGIADVILETAEEEAPPAVRVGPWFFCNENKFGFYVGERVNTKTCAVGVYPGSVTGFDDRAVVVKWDHQDLPRHYSPHYLRHGE